MNVSRVGNIMSGMDSVIRTMLDGDNFWPKGQCFGACMLLLPVLRASETSGTAFRVAVGSNKESQAHVWIEAWNMQSDEPRFRYVLDPTAGQFKFAQEEDDSAWAIYDEDIADNFHKYSIVTILNPEEEAKWMKSTNISRNIAVSSLTAGHGASAWLMKAARRGISDE